MYKVIFILNLCYCFHCELLNILFFKLVSCDLYKQLCPVSLSCSMVSMPVVVREVNPFDPVHCQSTQDV